MTTTITQEAIQTKVSSEAHHFICNVFLMSTMKVIESLIGVGVNGGNKCDTRSFRSSKVHRQV